MTSTEKLAKNTLYLTIASIGQKAIAFIYFALITRYFGSESTGEYFIALAVIIIIAAFIDLGQSPVSIREIGRKASDAKLWIRTLLGIRIVTIPAAFLIAFFTPVIFNYSAEVTFLVRLATVVMIADSLSLAFYGSLRGLHDLKYEAIGIFVGQAITATIGFILMTTNTATLPLMVGALMLGSIWNVFFSVINVVRCLGIKVLIPTYKLGWKPIKMGFAFFLAALFVKIYSYTDSLLLEKFLTTSAVGLYAVAYKLTYAFQFLPLAFIGALYPTMSAYAHDENKLRKIFLQSMWYMAFLGMPIVFGIWSLAPEIVNAIYGAEYNDSIFPLQILIFVLIPIFLDFPVGSLLNATNRQHIKTSIIFVTMIINVTANLILIPKMGVAGASTAGLISFIFLFITGWFFAQKVVNVTLIDLFKQIGGIIISALIMGLVVVLVKSHVPFVLAIPLGAIVYFTSAFVVKAITFEQVSSIKRVLRKKTYAAENISSNS